MSALASTVAAGRMQLEFMKLRDSRDHSATYTGGRRKLTREPRAFLDFSGCNALGRIEVGLLLPVPEQRRLKHLACPEDEVEMKIRGEEEKDEVMKLENRVDNDMPTCGSRPCAPSCGR